MLESTVSYVLVSLGSNSFTKAFVQETNEMSGSRGEANFVWKCKNCKVSVSETEPSMFANKVLI
jgi:hypothetical protein